MKVKLISADLQVARHTAAAVSASVCAGRELQRMYHRAQRCVQFFPLSSTCFIIAMVSCVMCFMCFMCSCHLCSCLHVSCPILTEVNLCATVNNTWQLVQVFFFRFLQVAEMQLNCNRSRARYCQSKMRLLFCWRYRTCVSLPGKLEAWYGEAKKNKNRTKSPADCLLLLHLVYPHLIFPTMFSSPFFFYFLQT